MHKNPWSYHDNCMEQTNKQEGPKRLNIMNFIPLIRSHTSLMKNLFFNNDLALDFLSYTDKDPYLAGDVLILRPHGNSWGQIASALGMATTAAWNLHQRAKKELKGENR